MRSWLLACLIVPVFALRGTAAVIVVANYTTGPVTVSLSEPDQKPRKHTIPEYQVLPLSLTGPAELKLPTEGKDGAVRVDPYHAYALISDKSGALHIEALELPGQAPERDSRPELNPIPREPVKIPVTLLIDDVDPRADMVWKKQLRERFDAAAQILETQTGFRFEFTGYDTWTSDAKATDILTQLKVFEDAVKEKPNALAIGYTSQKLDDAQPELGACRGLGSSHIVIREWRPTGEPERVEVLVRYLAISLGAVTSPDPGSAMRPKVGDGKALHADFKIRLDPLNVLALNLLADQRRQHVNRLDAIPAPDRARLVRVYSALLQAFPADPLALDYLNVLEQEVARGPEARNPNGAVRRGPVGAAEQSRRLEAVRSVVRAIAERARANDGPAAVSGDDLTAALLSAGATAAQRLEEADRPSAFLLGVAIGLDDRGALLEDPATAAVLGEVETDAERQERVAALGNPTIRNRRDLCRRFALGCAAGELLTPTIAENGAINRAMFEAFRSDNPEGFSFPALGAEFSGVAFARLVRGSPDDVFKKLRGAFSPADIAPAPTGLRDAVGSDKFEAEYGGVNDERFKSALKEIRKRIQSLPINTVSP
jgi:hypothetical protein